MANYEQMELDITLEWERNLKDNVGKVIQFVYDGQNLEREKNGQEIRTVRNKHEGYGIAAEAHNKIQICEKDLKNGMGDYLAMLQVDGEEGIQVCARLYDGALNLAINAINMAADMNRILNDLYYGSGRKTPIERAIEESEASDDGFEEAAEVDSAAEEMEGEESAMEENESECEGAEDATEEGEE